MLLAPTGATGFIGQYLLRELPKRGYRLRVLLRRPSSVSMQCASAVIGDLARPLNLSAALEGTLSEPKMRRRCQRINWEDFIFRSTSCRQPRA
jgi:nucleoside-diphosphate-sugar epimerase